MTSIPGASSGTPQALGFMMPAEFEPQEAVWLSWPHDRDSFPALERVEASFTRFIHALHVDQEVRLFVTGAEMQARAELALVAGEVDLDAVVFYTAPYADVWLRDYGPIFIVNRDSQTLAMTHWVFNAWGEKYPALMPDTKIPKTILKHHPMRCFRPGLVLEGGSIDVNGQGTLLTTEQCLLAKTRNPRLSRGDIESALWDHLGVENVIWLGEGIAGDDTDGHVDDIARFVSPDTVVCAYEDDPADINHAPLKKNFELLKKSKDQDGRLLRIVKLPMPGPVTRPDKSRLPASYANFFIGTKTVAVPVFNHANDARALEILSGLFPGRRVAGIDCRDVVFGLGTLHCMSQQQPFAKT